MTVLQLDFKIEDNDFRKVYLYKVPLNKIDEYESSVEKRNEANKAMGLNYNHIVYKAMTGYPLNTYANYGLKSEQY
jgi:hypothetical protein